MIEVKNLIKKFGPNTVLNSINFSVKEGEIFGFLGPNGAGKTTTMRIILGLLCATEGEALVWGHDLGNDDELRRRTGVLLEYDGLYERMSAQQNLEYFARLYDVKDYTHKVQELLEFTGLRERKNDLVGTFSRGMRRKLGLARAIIHQPDVLFLDEPSAGLDPEAQKMVRDLIVHLSGQKITIFLNSHDLDEVERICSSIAILQRGEIKIHESMDALRSRLVTDALQIVMSSNETAEKAFSLLRSLDYLSNFSRKRCEITATMDSSKTPSSVIAYLMERGLGVEEIKRTTRSLEDLYLEIIHTEQKDE